MKIQASASVGILYNSIIFQKVVIRYLQQAETDREDNDDNRYARNRIQSQSWFRSEERRDFLRTNLGIRHAQRQVEWKEGLVESFKAKSPKAAGDSS